jgi:hypothetical protein
MTGSGAVLALVLLEWTGGWIAVAAWNQSWKVVKRGHFRITAWATFSLALMTLFANRSAVEEGGAQPLLVVAVLVAALLYLAAQYLESEVVAVITGAGAGLAALAALIASAGLLEGWSQPFAAAHLIAGALFLGAVTNGMMLGHWYLNQPGLKPWALARLTQLALGATAVTGLLGLAAAGRLTEAETEGAVLGLPGFGESFGFAFYGIWVALLVFSGVVVWMARRCINIKSIQSATGLYYVAILTAGVAEFLLRYLMVNSAS